MENLKSHLNYSQVYSYYTLYHWEVSLQYPGYSEHFGVNYGPLKSRDIQNDVSFKYTSKSP